MNQQYLIKSCLALICLFSLGLLLGCSNSTGGAAGAKPFKSPTPYPTASQKAATTGAEMISPL